MIRITKLTDYGIVLMSLLADGRSGLINATELAQEAQLPQPMVSKILKKLSRGGLLVSHRGVRGGYELERDPAEVSVAAIIEALEGPIAVTECIDEAPGECSNEGFCPVQGNWQRINGAIRQALEAISLAEMRRPELPEQLVTLGSGSPSLRTSAEVTESAT